MSAGRGKKRLAPSWQLLKLGYGFMRAVYYSVFIRNYSQFSILKKV